MSETLRDKCNGRWRALLGMFGVDQRHLTGKHGPCPVCGGTDRFRFDDKNGVGTWICSQCGAGDGIALLMKLKGWDFKETAAQLEERVGGAERLTEARRDRSEKQLREAMNRLWKSGDEISVMNAAGAYLHNRGIDLPEWPSALRYVEKCRYQAPDPIYYPAMIAKVTGPDGIPVTVHRTYLTADGKKAPEKDPRRLMPGKLAKGSAVRLARAGQVIGIAEGIETALSASIIWNIPCWAAVNAGMLMAWEPPEGVRDVYIFGDNDQSYAGQQAAFALAHRLSAVNKLTVRVEFPVDPGMDWNDVLRAERRIAA